MFGFIKTRVLKWLKEEFPEYPYYRTVKEGEIILAKHVKLYRPVRLFNVKVGAYSYVGRYSHLKDVEIGKFCSIGPGCFFGWGIHPTNGLSTSPMFYSTLKQNGMTLSMTNKIVEEKRIVIGNDVFIGMNVTILDGVRIGDGAIIGAGAVVSKDIPPYAIAVGNPIRILRYRFPESKVTKLLEIKWWDFSEEKLHEVEKNFFDIDAFISNHEKLQ